MDTKTSAQGVDAVSRWRCDRLVDSGFAPQLAASIANDGRYDLHALIKLVDRGCRPELAVQILAPLEAESAA
jgi:hypothetical protein